MQVCVRCEDSEAVAYLGARAEGHLYLLSTMRVSVDPGRQVDWSVVSAISKGIPIF